MVEMDAHLHREGGADDKLSKKDDNNPLLKER